jgi:hypothetical protein
MTTQPSSSDDFFVRQLRIAQSEFNSRYQTYSRTVHFVVYYSCGTSCLTPEKRRAEAADNFARVHPFAAISYAFTNSEAYVAAMGGAGVVSFFGSEQVNIGAPGAQASFFRANPGRLWSFEPSLEYRAQLFSDMICREVAGRTVSFSGNPGEDGAKRKYGLLIHGSDSKQAAELQPYSRLIEANLQNECGVQFADTGHKYVDSSGAGAGYVSNATTTMATFKKDGITTVIDVGIGIYESIASGKEGYS